MFYRVELFFPFELKYGAFGLYIAVVSY